MPTLTQGAGAGARARPHSSAEVAAQLETLAPKIERTEAYVLETSAALNAAIDADAPDERIAGLRLASDTHEGTLVALKRRRAELRQELAEAQAREARQQKHDTLAAHARAAHAAHEAARAKRAALHEACRRLVPEILAVQSREADERRAFREHLRELVPDLFGGRRTTPAEDAAALAQLDAILCALAADGVPLGAVRAEDGFSRVPGLEQSLQDLPLVPFGAAIEMAVRLGAEAQAGRPFNIPGMISSRGWSPDSTADEESR